MKRKIIIAVLTCAALVLLAGLLLHQRAEPELVYQGKPLSVWLEVYDPTNAVHPPMPKMLETRSAILHMGTNAIPALLGMLRSRDSRFKVWFFGVAQRQHVIRVHYDPDANRYERAARAMRVFDADAEIIVPELAKIYDRNLSTASQITIARLFEQWGPRAKAAVPVLVRGADSTNYNVRLGALGALWRIHAEPKLTVPAFVKALGDGQWTINMVAIHGLQELGPEAKPAVPALLNILESDNSPSNNVRRITLGKLVQDALQHIDPGAANRVLTNVSLPK